MTRLGGLALLLALASGEAAATGLSPETQLLQARARADLAAGRAREATETLKQALTSAPDAPELHADLGLAYMARGNWFFAERALRRAHAVLPARGDIAHALGVCLARSGRPDDALPLLERAADEDAAARYAAGTAAYELGRWRAAREHFGHAAAAGPPEAQAPAADYVEATWAAEHGRPPRASVSAVLGIEIDTNPALLPDAEPASGGDDSHAGAPEPSTTLKGVLSASASLHPWWGARGGLRVSASLRHTESRDEVADDFDTTQVGAGLALLRRIWALGLDQELGASYGFSLIRMRGGLNTGLSLDPFIFSESHEAGLSWRVWQGEDAWVTTRYRLARPTYRERTRSGLRHVGSVGQAVLLGGGRVRVDLQAAARADDAQGDGYDLWALGVTLGGSVVVAPGVQAFLLLPVERSDHHASEGYWEAGQRVDLRTGAQAGVTWRMLDNLQASAQWRWDRRQSSLPDRFSFDRNQVTVFVVGAL